jgi:hypothetical protein
MFLEIIKFFHKMIEKRKHCHVFESNAIDGNERIIMWVEFCLGRLKLDSATFTSKGNKFGYLAH